MDSVGERIKYLRDSRGMTIVELSRILSVSPGTLVNMEKGRTDVSAKTLLKLSELFNVSCDWIVSGKDTKESDMYIELVEMRMKLRVIENALRGKKGAGKDV